MSEQFVQGNIVQWKPELIQLTNIPNLALSKASQPVYVDPQLISVIAVGKSKWSGEEGDLECTQIWLSNGQTLSVTEPPQRVNHLRNVALGLENEKA